MGMQQSDKIEVERLKLCNIGQNFLRVTDFTFCSFVKESFKSSLINKVVKYYIWVFSNNVWIFCSTCSTNVPFCLSQSKHWYFVHCQVQYFADFKQSFNISFIHQCSILLFSNQISMLSS